MDNEDPCNISEILLAGGFPHIEVRPETRLLAYECVLTSEVITKRVAVLDDLCKGLKSEKHLGTDLLHLATLHPEIERFIFPEPNSRVNLGDLQELVRYDLADNEAEVVNAKKFMERYMKDLDARGK